MRKLINLVATLVVASMFTACSANADTTVVVSEPSVTTTVANISNETQAVPTTNVVTDRTESTETQPTTNVIDDVLGQWTDDNGKIGANATAVEVNADSVIDITGQGLWPNTAYNFVKAMTTGSTFTTENKTVSFPYEGRWGIDAYAEGKTLNIKAYSNLGYNPTISSVMLSSLNQDVNITSNMNYDTYYAIDLSNASGTYKIATTFVVNATYITNELIVYVDSNEVWLCELATLDVNSLIARRNTFNTYMSDLNFTPENQLGITDIAYPHVQTGAYTCDTTKWAELSTTIITNPDWSDGYKVMMIHDWICENIAYDNYRVNNLPTPRDLYYGDCTGTYSVYNTRTGTCFDVSHIFLIMCRYNGIPCMTCESASHQWNAVYINGIWYEIDLTSDIHRFTNTVNVNDVITNGSATYSATDYGSALYTINNHLWSYECDYGSGENYGWYYN